MPGAFPADGARGFSGTVPAPCQGLPRHGAGSGRAGTGRTAGNGRVPGTFPVPFRYRERPCRQGAQEGCQGLFSDSSRPARGCVRPRRAPVSFPGRPWSTRPMTLDFRLFARTMPILMLSLAACSASPHAGPSPSLPGPPGPQAGTRRTRRGAPSPRQHVAPAAPVAPVAARRSHPLTIHGETRDDYYWLRDDSRQNPEMLAYLAAENAYTQAILAPTEPLQARLHQELAGRLKQDDDTVPYRQHGYWYYRRYEAGKEYDRLYRRRGSMTAPEELLLDLNELARGHDFFAPRRMGCDAGRKPPRLDGGHRQPPAVHASRPRPRDRRAPRRDHRQLLGRGGLGERQPDLLLHREGSGDAARLPCPPPPARQRSGGRPGRLGGEGQDVLHRHLQVEVGPFRPHRVTEHCRLRSPAARR